MKIHDLIKYRILSNSDSFSFFLPKKMVAAVKLVDEKHLRKIYKHDLAAAREFILYFLSFLSRSLIFKVIIDRPLTKKEEKKTWKRLHSRLLQNLLSPARYHAIIEACEQGTSDQGPFIEIKNHCKGITSKRYRFSPNYGKCSAVKYTLKTKQAKSAFLRNQIKKVNKGLENPIIQNLLKFYSNPDFKLPTKDQLTQVGQLLVNDKQKTKKGKSLLMKNGNPPKRFQKRYGLGKFSFVEDHIKQFNYLTTPGLRIPSPQGKNSGCRVTDSFNLMPSWIRAQIRVNQKQLVEVDFEALHPNIVMSIYGGKQHFITHKKMAAELGIKDEDVKDFKKEHLAYFNKKPQHMVCSNHGIHAYYAEHEPEMLDRLIQEKDTDGHKTTSRQMFAKEVEIMTDCIKRLNEEGIYVLYVYDALLCEESHTETVQRIMNETAIAHGVYTRAKSEPLSRKCRFHVGNLANLSSSDLPERGNLMEYMEFDSIKSDPH